MAGRRFVINGEAMVKVKFGSHIASGMVSGTVPDLSGAGQLYELGLTLGDVTITPRFLHRELSPDDFGGNIPAEVLWGLGDASISMNLVHYDKGVLDTCLHESMGGTSGMAGGRIMGAGVPLGNWLFAGASGCHYVSLNVLSPQLNFPWRFPTCYLPAAPVQIPLGTTRTMAQVTFRAIPYVKPTITRNETNNTVTYTVDEIASSGSTLWDHTLDV